MSVTTGAGEVEGGQSYKYCLSFLVYSKLLEVTEEDEMKSDIYAAMGMLAVKCDDTDTARTAFFQWLVPAFLYLVSC